MGLRLDEKNKHWANQELGLQYTLNIGLQQIPETGSHITYDLVGLEACAFVQIFACVCFL